MFELSDIDEPDEQTCTKVSERNKQLSVGDFIVIDGRVHLIEKGPFSEVPESR